MGVCLEKPDLCIITEFLERGSLFEILVEPSYWIEEEHLRGVFLGHRFTLTNLVCIRLLQRHGLLTCLPHHSQGLEVPQSTG